MESSVSSIVSRLGAGSGIDMVQLASDLADVRFEPQITRLETRNELLESRISAASTLRSLLTDLASALGERIRTGDLSPQGRIGNGSVASVSVEPGANPQGTYQLEVTQLASSQTLVLGAYSSAQDLVGEGNLTIRFGTIGTGGFTPDANQTALDIALDPSDTLQTLAQKINAASGPVTAYVANGTNGAQLVLKGAEGAANGFTIEASSASGQPVPGDPAYLAWDSASDTGQLRSAASDAAFLLDTVAMTSSSNTVTGLPEGIRLSLSGTNIGAPTSISFADRSSEVSKVMGDLVAALNDITSQLNQSGAALGGELGADPAVRRLKASFSSLATKVIMPNAAPGDPVTLGDLGLATNRDGSFRLDSARLQRTLQESPKGAMAMFTTGLFGVYATIDKLARSMSARGDPGSLAGSIERYQSQIDTNEEKLARIAEQQESLRERMVRQFASADRNVAEFNSTLSFLRSQIAVWNADNN